MPAPRTPTIQALERDLATAVGRYREAEATLEQAREQRDRLILDAHGAGITATRLAELADLTPKRIDQIRRGHDAR